MKKTIDTLRTASKAGRIISKVIFILCIVGFALCAAGILCLALIPDGLKIGGLTVRGIVETKAELSVGTCFAAMAVGTVFSAGSAVIAKMSEIYFTHELEAGTPFTFDGAKELMRLGIFYLCVGVATSGAAGIVYSVIKAVFKDVAEMKTGYSFSLFTGALIIIMSLLCRLGAEAAEQRSENTEQMPQ
ncbi:MAG: hypothetical protein IJS94_09190 [Clostridia bacterium]|nr:hypothetical protein [Clostridia bacterium]